MPTNVDTSPSPTSPLVVRAIVALLAIGLAGFTAVAVTIALLGAAGAPEVRLPLAVATAAVLVCCLVVTAIVPAAMARAAARAATEYPNHADAILDRQWQAASIIRATLAEAPGLFGAVALLLTGELWFALAPLVALALLVPAFPTTASRDRFVARAQRTSR